MLSNLSETSIDHVVAVAEPPQIPRRNPESDIKTLARPGRPLTPDCRAALFTAIILTDHHPFLIRKLNLAASQVDTQSSS